MPIFGENQHLQFKVLTGICRDPILGSLSRKALSFSKLIDEAGYFKNQHWNRTTGPLSAKLDYVNNHFMAQSSRDLGSVT